MHLRQPAALRALGVSLLLLFPPTAARAADTAAAVPLLPSETSELQHVYDTLRGAARRGDVPAFREMYDPTTLGETYTDAQGHRERLTRRWLRAHAREWPDVGRWDVAEAQRADAWARLTFRHHHLVDGRADGRWDFYFLLFHNDGGIWRMTRRAIATFGTADGMAKPPPRVADLTLIPQFELPPGTVGDLALPPAP